MIKEGDFLGRGWAFPPDFSWQEKGVKMVSGEDDIIQSLHILFSTLLGERVMQYEFGCDLYAMVFEQFDSNTITLLKDTLETAVLYHEPRIKLLSIEAEDSLTKDYSVRFTLTYIIRGTNTRTNMVYPFYLLEADTNFYRKV